MLKWQVLSFYNLKQIQATFGSLVAMLGNLPGVEVYHYFLFPVHVILGL